ncbi:MAG TPA: acyl-CoA dehydrogenase family protein [Acetobacteraceae bacterium]|nr:acyl-CoA dehydrogenase family protein [Acetobacteraceae bacterium]
MQDTVTRDAVATAAGLASLIVSAREEAEAMRCTPPRVVEALAAAGLLQMFLPRSLGGAELPPLAAFHAIEELSKADGSVGWCTMIATVLSQFTGWLDPGVARAMVGTPADFRAAGSLRPQGQAREVDGGYRVSGRWNFASGVTYAKWLYCTCRVMDGDAPRLTPTGAPLTRAAWVPVTSARIEDTWSVVGLRATGSHDFVIDDVFVDNAYTSSFAEPAFEPNQLYSSRLFFVTLWVIVAANALGIARGAIDAFIELAGRSSTSSPVPLRDRAAVQSRVAEAEAILGAARAFVLNTVAAVWDGAGGADPSLAIAQARLAITHAIHEAVRAVDVVFHAAGTNAIYSANPLERHFRDVHVVVQHNAAFAVHYASAGKVLLGLRPSDPGW